MATTAMSITHDETTHWTTGFPADSDRAAPSAEPRLTPTNPAQPKEEPP